LENIDGLETPSIGKTFLFTPNILFTVRPEKVSKVNSRGMIFPLSPIITYLYTCSMCLKIWNIKRENFLLLKKWPINVRVLPIFHT